MIAVDTNILVVAFRADAKNHQVARSMLENLVNGEEPCGIPVVCLAEFVRVTTHANIFRPPSPLNEAMQALDELLNHPNVRLLSPGPDFFACFRQTLLDAQASGNLAFDAQIAALCRDHRVKTLVTYDRDFTRFPHVTCVTPETLTQD